MEFLKTCKKAAAYFVSLVGSSYAMLVSGIRLDIAVDTSDTLLKKLDRLDVALRKNGGFAVAIFAHNISHKDGAPALPRTMDDLIAAISRAAEKAPVVVEKNDLMRVEKDALAMLAMNIPPLIHWYHNQDSRLRAIWQRHLNPIAVDAAERLSKAHPPLPPQRPFVR